MVRRLIPFALTALAAVAPATSAWAAPNSTAVSDDVRTGVETVACTGSTPWLVTEDNHEVVHTQYLADGALQFVDNDTQSFTVQHADGSGPVYRGRAVIHMAAIFPSTDGRPAPVSYVFDARGTAPDGSDFGMREVIHAQANPDGTVTVDFDHLSCG